MREALRVVHFGVICLQAGKFRYYFCQSRHPARGKWAVPGTFFDISALRFLRFAPNAVFLFILSKETENMEACKRKQKEGSARCIQAGGSEAPTADSLHRRLSGRLHGHDVDALRLAVCAGEREKQTLRSLLLSDDSRVAANAAWVFSHFPRREALWLLPYREELAELAMRTSSPTLLRLLLTIIEGLPDPAELRADFLDFCLLCAASPSVPPGTRSLCIKLAYAGCRPYPELLGELRALLELMADTPLPPSLRSVRSKVLRAIATGRPARF